MPGKFKQIPYNLDIGSKQTVRRNTADDSFEVVEIYSKGETDTQLSNKVDKEIGKGLSTNDYTTTEKNKLAGIEANAEVNITENVNAGTNITIDRVGKDITINSTGGGGATTLDDLTDVVITTPTNGQALTYNGTEWVNSTPAGVGDMLKSVYDTNDDGIVNQADAITNQGDLATLDSVDTAQIETHAVTNTKLAQMNSSTVKGRLSGNGTPQDIDMADLPISTATQTALNGKQNILSEGAFVNGDKNKLDGIEVGAEVNEVNSVNGRTGAVTGLAEDNEVVKLTGNQTIGGVKTFSSSPIVPTPTADMEVATKKYVDDNSGGGGGSQIYEVYIAGELTTGRIYKQIVRTTQTISGVKISTDTLPTGANLQVQVYKNGIASTNSIFTSDTPIEITTGQGATNGVYTTTRTTIDNGSFAENDVLYIYITQVGTTLSGTNLSVLCY